MPSQKELDSGEKLNSRGPSLPSTVWRYRLKFSKTRQLNRLPLPVFHRKTRP